MKNFAELKRRLKVGSRLAVLEHSVASLQGTMRTVTAVQTNGYWFRTDGNSRDMYTDFNKASNYQFPDADTFVFKVGAQSWKVRFIPEPVTNESPDDPRLFVGVQATGIAYADKTREQDGDYVTIARLPFSTLELEWKGKPPEWAKPLILEDAKRIQAHRGEQFQVSTAGQTITLGD